MADITGARTTGNIAASIRKVDMRETVLELEPNVAPLTVLSSKLGSDNTYNPEFSWTEDDLEPRFDLVNNGAGYNSSATSIVVDNGAYFAQHDSVKVTRTGEIFRVTAVSTNTLTVVRGIGGGAAAIVDNDELLIVGSSQPEGDTSRPARSSNPTKVTNYTEITRTPFHATETLIHSDTITRPKDFDRQAFHAGVEHKKSLEYKWFHGKPSEDLTGSTPRRTTGGVFHYIQTNRTDVGGTMTEAEFFSTFSAGFRYSNGNRIKVAFASRLAVDVLNGYPKAKLEVVDQSADTYGLSIMRYRSPHGTLNVITHNLLEGTVYGGYIVVLDMDLVKKRPLGNSEGSRDTHIARDRQANDEDARKHEYITEAGLEFGIEKRHFIVSNITG